MIDDEDDLYSNDREPENESAFSDVTSEPQKHEQQDEMPEKEDTLKADTSSNIDDGDDKEKDEKVVASEKIMLEQSKNRAPFLSRQNILMAIFGGAILLIFVSLVIIPSFKGKKKKKEKTETAQVLIPREIENWNPVTNPYDPFATPPPEDKMAETNVDELLGQEATLEDLDNQIMLAQTGTTATNTTVQQQTQYYGGGYSAPQRQDTNRNEQQKSIQRMPIEDGFRQTGMQVSQQNIGNTGGLGMNDGGLGNYMGEYTNMMRDSMGQVSSMLGGMYGGNYKGQNDQDGKMNFASSGSGGGGFQWNGEYSLDYGTIIPATLVTGINTDLPGMIIARVTSNVWSSGGTHLLIPAGTRVFATYNSQVTYGQSRVQIAWNKMIRPDGLEVDLGNFLGVDDMGYVGSNGMPKYHAFEYLKAFGLIGAFSILEGEVDAATKGMSDTYMAQAMGSVYGEMNSVGAKMIDRALDIQPTLTIAQGTQLNIITNKTMEIPPFSQRTPSQKYVRRW